ncbi:hypothetical protein MHBO_003855, partial [Bonamia ostreae]
DDPTFSKTFGEHTIELDGKKIVGINIFKGHKNTIELSAFKAVNIYHLLKTFGIDKNKLNLENEFWEKAKIKYEEPKNYYSEKMEKIIQDGILTKKVNFLNLATIFWLRDKNFCFVGNCVVAGKIDE